MTLASECPDCPTVQSVMTATGYLPITTGGNVQAWQKNGRHRGLEYLITAHDGYWEGDPDSTIWTVGLYSANADLIAMSENVTLLQALDWTAMLSLSV